MNQTSSVLAQIKTRGYWQIIVRPERFIKERIQSLMEINNLVEKQRVQFRGWDFPHTEPKHRFGPDFVEMQTSFRSINDAWRFYQSGQIILYRSLSEDWIENEYGIGSPYYIQHGTKLSITSCLYQLSEAYEFAARLAQANIFDNNLIVEIRLINTENRELFFWPSESRRWLRRQYICTEPELPRTVPIKSVDLISMSREYSFKHFVWIMERFGFTDSTDIFKQDQDAFFLGRF